MSEAQTNGHVRLGLLERSDGLLPHFRKLRIVDDSRA